MTDAARSIATLKNLPRRSTSRFLRGRARAWWCKWALAVFAVFALRGSLAYAYEGGAAAVGFGETEKLSRGTWAALLVGYLALGALTTGGAYLFRDNLVGRSIAVSAGGWGGLGVGATTAYGIVQLRGCRSQDCVAENEVAIAVGGAIGAAVASVVTHFLTSEPGMSRPYAAAAGMAPAFVFLTAGTIFDW